MKKGYVEIPVQIDGGRGITIAKVSKEDAREIKRYKWVVRKAKTVWYAKVSDSKVYGEFRNMMMHRMILKPSRDQDVDHVNGDGLDNRRENIRACTHAGNATAIPAKARSGYRGVVFDGRKWIAIVGNGRGSKIGKFKTALEAAVARDAAALAKYGEMAWLNFPIHRQAPRSRVLDIDYIKMCDEIAASFKGRRELVGTIPVSAIAEFGRAWALKKAGIVPTPDGL